MEAVSAMPDTHLPEQTPHTNGQPVSEATPDPSKSLETPSAMNGHAPPADSQDKDYPPAPYISKDEATSAHGDDIDEVPSTRAVALESQGDRLGEEVVYPRIESVRSTLPYSLYLMLIYLCRRTRQRAGKTCRLHLPIPLLKTICPPR